jgi:hypothetical protein
VVSVRDPYGRILGFRIIIVLCTRTSDFDNENFHVTFRSGSIAGYRWIVSRHAEVYL